MNSGKSLTEPRQSLTTGSFLEAKSIKTPLFGPLDIGVGERECIAIRGKSGCGKSIFLRAIVDLDPNQGEVWLNGRKRSSFPAYEWRREVMLLPAESGWWADHVGEHFDKPDEASELLAAMALPEDVMTWRVSRLSSGERQRLSLARALNLEPQILLLDEPTAALDREATERVEAVLRNEMARGVGIILVTHDSEQAGRLAGSSYVLKDGQLTMERQGE